MNLQINVMKPKMPSADLIFPYLKQIDASGIYSNFGPLSSLFTSRLASYLGADEDCVVLMSNATLALQGSLSVLSEAGAGLDVVVPSWTFTASTGAALLAGLSVEFADIDDSWRVETNDSDSFVLDVLPFGEGLRMGSVGTLNPKWKVIDGAASFDALRGVASKLDPTSVLVVSLHATKLLGAGEGGFCVTGTPEVAKEIRAWSSFGFRGSRESQRIGTNSKISEYTAAVGLASLDMWDETRSILQMHLNKALEISKSCGLPITSAMQRKYVSPYWIVSFDSSEKRDRVQAKLNSSGIETRNWWGSGCHKMAAYRSIPHRILVNTEWAAETSLGLPFHAYLSDEDYDRIYKVLNA